MKKAIVIGCPGSGKTTFAEKLSLCTAIPLHHLDAIWHKPDKTHISREEFDNKLSEIMAESQWIIDGNYNRTLEIRIKNCDTVFLFDLPVQICIDGAKERLGKSRCDLPWTETELDLQFIHQIETFPDKSLPQIYSLLNKYGKNKDIIIFKSRQQADSYLENFTANKS